jgi:multidrug efflux pump subunit AcrB
VIVEATYANATASEIETLIAIPFERALNDLPGIKNLRSSSTHGRCRVEIEYKDSPPTQDALALVKAKVLEARRSFPANSSVPAVSFGQASIL